MKVIIAGSREITDIHHVKDAIALAQEQGITITEVVSGKARGVDSLGEVCAHLLNIPIKAFPANWNLHGRSAGRIRNQAMADYADALIAIWDGLSSGTHDMIARARAKGIPVYVHTVFHHTKFRANP